MLRDTAGVAPEVTYGTFVPPTRHHPILTEGLKQDRNRVKSGGRTDTQLAQISALVKETTRSGGGPLQFEPTSKGLGIWLNLLHGNTVTPTGGGANKTQVHDVGRSVPSGKSVSVEIGVEDVAAARKAKRASGCVVSEVEWKVATGGILEQRWTLAAQDVKTYNSTPTAAVYASGVEVFGFSEATVKLDGTGVTDCLVTEATINLSLPRKTDRFGLNGSALNQFPVVNGKIAVTGSFVAEFQGNVQTDAFHNATLRSFGLTCLGTTDIATGIKPSIDFLIPIIRVTDATPMSSDEDVKTLNITFEAEIGDTLPLMTITTVSTDTAL